MSSRCCVNGCLYSGLAWARWPTAWRIIRAYGREACIRSCALRIFDAETISNARVTLRVFLMLLIWPTISFDPLIRQFPVSFQFQMFLSERFPNRDMEIAPTSDSDFYQLPVFLNSSSALFISPLMSSFQSPVSLILLISSV